MSNPGLYVHVPFCRSKCPYCAFYSLASASLIPRWLNAIRKEIHHYKGFFHEFDSLYLGGGTPTFLEVGDLNELVKYLLRGFHFARDTEITIEANPCDLTREKTKALGELGFNRVSLGVQSFNDDILAFLGRRHTAEQSKKAIEDLRSFGFENIGLDLIYGLEGQTLKDWIRTLKQAMGFEPEHLSCYQLAIEKGTPFGRLYERGLLMPPGEEKERNFFLATSHFLKERGYIHYEISNFAKNASLVSRHNCKYWFHVPYLGLGPSAHSFHNSTRRWNTRSLKKYCEMLENGNIPVEGYENLTEDQLDLERISLGLRTRQGFDAQKLPDNPALKGALSSLRDSGFLKITNNRIVPTGKGFLVADSLPLYFL